MNKTAEKVAKLLIGEKVKQLYTQRALSQKEIAAKAGVNVKTMRFLENGETAKPDTLRRVAEALNVPVTEFSILLGLDNGSIAQMSLPELNSLKMSLSKLVESRKINHEEYVEMREIIQMAEKPETRIELPPLPPPPEDVESPPTELTEPLERLNFIDVIKRVLTETKPWVKYAPVDKNQPTLAHKLRERAFISQPYFCDLGFHRVGFFKQGFSGPGALYMAISRNGTNEGLVVTLWPSLSFPILPTLFYRSLKNNEKIFHINLRDFEVYSQTQESYHYNDQVCPELLNVTMISNPNFMLQQFGAMTNAYGYWHPSHGVYPNYNPNRLIKVGELPPIYIPWNIESWDIHLTYIHPIEPMWFKLYSGLVEIELKLGKPGEYSNFMVTWPRFSKFVTKLLTALGYSKYKNCLNHEGVDLIALTDNSAPKQKPT